MNELDQQNKLDLTNYRVTKSNTTVFKNASAAYCLSNNLIICYAENKEYWVSFTSILDVYLMATDSSILIVTKDLTIICFEPINKEDDSSNHIFNRLCEKVKQNRAADYCLEFYKTITSHSTHQSDYVISRDLMYKEFERMNFRKDVWEVASINRDYILCSTYCQNIIFPQRIPPSLLKHMQNFRDQQRFPIVSHFNGKNILLRCSQPMMGVLNKNSVQDENLIKEYIRSADLNDPSRENKNKLMIVDCRPLKNAMAQQYIMGGGSEQVINYQYADIPGNYDTTKKIFLNLPNIHIVSSQFEHMLMNYTLGGLNEKKDLENSCLEYGWYQTISQTLEHLDYLLKEYLLNATHFLIHCTHGWDRTSLITSLIMICSDPFYRTVKGFFTLIQLEWLDYGFRFAERFDVQVSNTSTELERLDLIVEEAIEKQEENSFTGKTVTSIFQFVKNKKKDILGNKLDNLNLLHVNSIKKKLDLINITGDIDICKKMSSNNADSWSSLLTNSTENNSDPRSQKSKPKGGKSPVFVQFLDLVWQIINQHPDKFEYNESFLLRFLENVVSGKFAEFLKDCDCERESFFQENKLSGQDLHWSRFFDVKAAHINASYQEDVFGSDEAWIFPDFSKVAVWELFWSRRFEKASID